MDPEYLHMNLCGEDKRISITSWILDEVFLDESLQTAPNKSIVLKGIYKFVSSELFSCRQHIMWPIP